MSGMEVVAVLSCVAAVISAYKDGGNIVRQIKEKRAARKALPPTRILETSLQRGPPAVEEAKDMGIERYGHRFAEGDNILIHLQGTLLRHLWVAREDDNVVDFNILVDASDLGRVKSVTVLNELFMRMAQAAPLERALPQPSRVQTIDSTGDPGFLWENQVQPPAHLQDYAQSPVHALSPQAPPAQHTPSPHEYAVDSSFSKSSKSAGRKWFQTSKLRKSNESTPQTQSNTSALNTLASQLTINDSPLGIQIDGNAHSSLNSSAGDVGSSNVMESHPGGVRSPSWKPSPEISIDEYNPWQTEVSSSLQDLRGAASSSHDPRKPCRQSTEATLVEDEGAHFQEPRPYALDKRPTLEAVPLPGDGRSFQGPRPGKMRLPSWPGRRPSEAAATPDDQRQPHRSEQKSRIAPIISRTKSAQPSLQNPASGGQNTYGGFCVGAYKMQVRFEQESFKLRNQSVSMAGQSHYWACANSKCVFEGPARKLGKSWAFSNIVKVQSGVQYRWSFLAKSHVALSRTQGREFDYQCLFCIARDHHSAVYHTDSVFIEHVSTHRGQPLEPSLSEKLCCIDGRVAVPQEEFDINLTPRVGTQGADANVHEQGFVTANTTGASLESITLLNRDGRLPVARD